MSRKRDSPLRLSSVEGVLITCSPESEAFALEELRQMFPGLPPLHWIDDGLALAHLSFDLFAATVERCAPIFVRHIAPVQREVALQSTADDIAALRATAQELGPQLDPARTFAVQSRLLGFAPSPTQNEGKQPYRRFTLNHELSQALEAQTGATMSAHAPDQVVSLLCTPTTGYLGVSWAKQNRSDWPGGQHRFLREEAQISRAEFKLLEALSVFRLSLPEEGTALDMGAAPGGWTRVLREHGLGVVAVDPAEMDRRLSRDAGVTLVRKRIQDYLPRAQRFDLIVNDMRMDAHDSVEIMLSACPHLKQDGLAILTLKLPLALKEAKQTPATVRLALDRLSQSYRVLGARQLYHNRSEVTIALRRADASNELPPSMNSRLPTRQAPP